MATPPQVSSDYLGAICSIYLELKFLVLQCLVCDEIQRVGDEVQNEPLHRFDTRDTYK
ncbi:hypothetical protein J6590_096692 [Homalodisca vitripennis]|nr:hypothetical protein J6590_096692 [Homalodisca vitripennis]